MSELVTDDSSDKNGFRMKLTWCNMFRCFYILIGFSAGIALITNFIGYVSIVIACTVVNIIMGFDITHFPPYTYANTTSFRNSFTLDYFNIGAGVTPLLLTGIFIIVRRISTKSRSQKDVDVEKELYITII